MRNTVKITSISVVLLVTAVLLQSTLFDYIAIQGVKPDLCTIILVFIALRAGSMVGQFSGFLAGLTQDILSLTPMGFFSLIRTILGNVYGFIQGSMFANSLFIPIIFIFSATLIKGLLTWSFALIFSVTAQGIGYFGAKFWIEVAYNSILAPFVFTILGLIKVFKEAEREEA
jgi:rod shape-determining protein MreD